jgi:ABC-2 type transport system permease protein
MSALTPSLKAELAKMWRPRPLAVAAVVTAVCSFGAAFLVLAAAEENTPLERGGVSIAALADPGGGTEVFRTAISFTGFFVFILVVAILSAEFTRGTFRTMLLRQPRRLALLAGKVGAILISAAVLLAFAEVVGWLAARLFAPGQGVDTSAWVSLEGLTEGAGDYGSALFWVTGYTLLGTALAVVVRSTTVALAIGFAWAGPFEHILADSWSPALEGFPGLLLEQFVAGGSAEVTVTQAFVTVLVYMAAAAVIAGTSVVRRDVL